MSVAGGHGKWVWQMGVAAGCGRWAWQVGEAHLPATPTSLTHLSHIPATVLQEADDCGSFFVEFGRTDKKYVDLRELVKQICHVYPLPNPLEAILGFVRLYAVTGCDFNPFFKYLLQVQLLPKLDHR